MHLNEQGRRREVVVELGRHIPDCTISNEQLPNDCYKVLNQLMGPGKKKFIESTKHKRANTSCDILNEEAGTRLSASDYGIIVLPQLSVSQGCAGNAKPGRHVQLPGSGGCLMLGGHSADKGSAHGGMFLPVRPDAPESQTSHTHRVP